MRANFTTRGRGDGPAEPRYRFIADEFARYQTIESVDPPASELNDRIASVKAWIEAKPGADGKPFSPRKSSPPLVIVYTVMGKMFAILSVRGIEDVILKCDPLLASALRKDYNGVGHRSHLDRRFWISVRLDSDVPVSEIERLVSLSYDLVCEGLTAKQRAELASSMPKDHASPEK